jgi:hypothetical protein
MIIDDPAHLVYVLNALTLRSEFFSAGAGRPMPGHARAVEGGEGSATVEWSFTRSAENGMSNLQ